MKELLFEAFAPSSKADWQKQVIKELKNASFESLVWKDLDDFEIEPLYEDQNLDYQAYFLSQNMRDKARQWRNRQKIGVSNAQEANKKMLNALENGADELLLDIVADVDIDVLFEGVFVEACAISFRLEKKYAHILEKYAQKVAHLSEQISGSIYFKDQPEAIPVALKPLKSIFLSTSLGKPSEQVADILTQFLAVGEQNFEQVQIEMNLSNLFFVEIAKLRALGVLLKKTLLLAQKDALQVPILARTRIQKDAEAQKYPYNNLLSNTIQAMAGVLGNCDILEITPFNEDIGEVNDFSERIARNISNLLREESYLDSVADPAAGSYYVEYLTDKIAELAWQKLQQNIA